MTSLSPCFSYFSSAKFSSQCSVIRNRTIEAEEGSNQQIRLPLIGSSALRCFVLQCPENDKHSGTMSRRNHLTELGCIACEDLTQFGAGKEGWLVDSPNLLCSLDTHALAIANRTLVIVLGWSDPSSPRVKIRPDLSPIEAEFITAIEWLVFDDIRVLAIGTSRGYLLIYSLDGVLIHRQIIYTARILRLRVRGTKKDLAQDASAEEVCVVMPGAIARFDGSEVQNMVQRWMQETQAQQFWDEKSDRISSEDMANSSDKLTYQLWNVSKYGVCADAAITGIMPPPLMEVQSSQRYYCAITIGDDAVISAFRLSEDRSRSLVGAILSRVVPTISSIASLSKFIWGSAQASPEKEEVKPQSFARASPLTCLNDYPRRGEKLTLSPSGTLAAIADSLGRILLLDTQALVVVRLWKGYREASCLFMEMVVNKKSSASSSSSYYGAIKSDYCLCLAIHAPRKGIVEVWQMRTGPRLLAIPCPKGSRILQPTYRFESSSSSPYVPLEVFLLNGDSGRLTVLNRFLN